MDEMRITLRLVELKGGGFVIAEEIIEDGEITYDATQAVSSVDEACGAVQRRLREWHQECKALRAARLEDENSGRVIAPRLWWRRVK